MGGIFINYRNGAHAAIVRALYERLVDHFGADQVFLDQPSIHAGDRYPDAIRERLADADVLLAVVHRGWSAARGPDGRRLLDRPGDWVRQELEVAFEDRKTVIPILLDDAQPPTVAELPTSIVDLAHRQARRIHGDRVPADATALIADLERDVAPTWSPRRAEPKPTPAVSPFWLVPAIGLLVVPTLCTIGQSGRPLFVSYVAVVSTLLLLARLVAGLPGLLFQRRINSWERDTHMMAPRQFYRGIGIPFNVLYFAFVGVLAVVGAVSYGFSGIEIYVVLATLFFVVVLALVGVRIIRFREERTDEQRERFWPEPLPIPPDPIVLRREVRRLGDRLDDWSGPLSREQTQKARWAVESLRDNVNQLRSTARRGRRPWLLGQPVRAVRYLWWTAGTVGCALAGFIPEVVHHRLSGLRGGVQIVVAVLLVYGMAAAILELEYRRVRVRAVVMADDVTGEVDRLDRRLAQLLRPVGS